MTLANLDAAAALVLAWLLTYAIHSTIMFGVAALAARRLAEHHAWVDLIWKTALIAPLVTASLNVGPIDLPVGGRWTLPAVTTMTTPVAAPPAIIDEAPARPTVRVEPAETPRVIDRSVPSESRVSVLAIIAAAWLLTAMAAVARYAVRLRRVYRALGSGLPLTSTDLREVIDRLRTSAHGCGSIRVTTNAGCPVPLALAGRHIVLPERFLHQLEPELQHAALAHEVAHVIRRDCEWGMAMDLLERVMFFQPLNRLARLRLRDTAEFLCDEWAVQHTQSPLALARCLSAVAEWWSTADELPAGVSAMARSDSAMVQRVARILSEPARARRRPRLLWMAIPVALVAVAAPRVQATRLGEPMAMPPAAATSGNDATTDRAVEQRATPRQTTPAEMAAARAQLRDYRRGGSLEDRWRLAMADAGRQGGDFWIVYTLNTPTHGDDVILADTRDGSFVTSDGRIATDGPQLGALLNPSAIALEGGNLAVLLHYRSARADALDRAGYRSLQLGFDFQRRPVFWLGDAPESESFGRVRTLFDQARVEKLQILLIELASLHSNTDLVAPFLTRLVEPSWPPAIRAEAAEGFDHHHDPRSVEILLRVARTDSDSSVRAEAAETIGEVQTPQSIAALLDLANDSPDAEVRREAAEGFAGQPAARAIPAIESIVAANDDADVVSEAIEALGELGEAGDPGVLKTLTRIAWEHRDLAAQREAVETLGDRQDDAAWTSELERIAREHKHEEVQAEAIEAIADRPDEPLHPVVLELAISSRSARVRREALEAIGGALDKLSDAGALDRLQQVIEKAIFDDPDQAVRMEALDALDELPDDRAERSLRDVIARHPDARVRREAAEQLRERQ
jgi:HEAT repeat protein/beta-lactamase regulating signal transducer with metallopeptidase domain